MGIELHWAMLLLGVILTDAFYLLPQVTNCAHCLQDTVWIQLRSWGSYRALLDFTRNSKPPRLREETYRRD